MSNNQYYDFFFHSYSYDQVPTFPGEGSGLEKYLALLPINELKVSLGEGNTPLTKSTHFSRKCGITQLYIKHEELNPTGCFKDRESAVVVSAAIEAGHEAIHVVSSGNAALSTAAYASKAGLPCECLIPQSTSNGKKQLIQIFGAKLTEVAGNYEQIYRSAIEVPPTGWNVTSGANSLRIEANKTIAYEIWAEIGVPDYIVIPCGNGGGLAGIARGFWELKQLNLIDHLPRLVGVQIVGAAPLVAAMQNHTQFEMLSNIPDSMAEGIIAEESYCSPKVMWALQESNGFMLEVTESSIMATWLEVIQKEVVVAEPTSAAAYAVIPQLLELVPEADPSIVIINTGSGLKNLHQIIETLKDEV